MAGQEVGSLYYNLDIDDKDLSKKLDKADKGVKEFGGSVSNAGDKLRDGLNKASVAMAGVGAGLTLIAKNATDFTVDLVKDSKALAREIGVSTVEASRLTAAFSRMGIEADSARQMFGIFSKQIVASSEDASKNKIATQKLQLQIEDTKKSIVLTSAEIKKHGDKSGELTFELKTLNNALENQQNELNKAADGFAKLGVQTKDASGKQKDFTTLLFEVADKFKAMPDGIDKTALALELFGRSGKDLLKVLNLGGSGIQELEKNADALGLTLNEQTIGNVANYIAANKKMKEQTDALRIAIGTETLPVLTSFKQIQLDIVSALISTDGWVKTATVDFIAFGGPVLAGAAALIQVGAGAVQVATGFGVSSAAMIGFVGAAATVLGVISLIVAGLVAVKLALDSISDAWDAVNASANAAANLAPQGQMQELKTQADAARKRGDTAAVKRYTNALSALGGNAEGTDFWKGGLTWVGEKGPEVVNVPRGSQIIPNDKSKGMMGDNIFNIGVINDKSDADYILRRVDRNQERVNMGISPA